MTDKRKQKIRGQQISIKKKLFKLQNKPHCEFCGNDNEKILQIHHIKPVCEGGNNAEKNLIILCPNCHKLAHVGLISKEELQNARKRKKVFVTPEDIQKSVDNLKQIETDLKNSILKSEKKHKELEKQNQIFFGRMHEEFKQLDKFNQNHDGIKTKIQLCTYLNRIELKYQSLKEDYAKLQLENERLKTNLKNIELAAEKAEVKEKKSIFHFLGTAFFGLS